MQIAKYSQETTTSPSEVWRLWSDVNNWSKWDPDLEFSELNQEFKNGSKGFLKTKKSPKSEFELCDVVLNKSFTTKANLPFTQLYFKHEIENLNGKNIVTHTAELEGFGSFIFSKILSKDLQKSIEEAVQKMLEIV